MNQNDKEIIHYFVDEAGDPTLFDRKGRIIINENGCSNYFILGKMEIDDPAGVEESLENLRKELLADPYFKNVPSMQPVSRKTAIAFHAKDDLTEVRREVFKLLLQKKLRFYAVVRDKQDLVTYVQQQNKQDATYRYGQDEQYDRLVKELFRKLHHMADVVRICFAKRGTRSRSAAFRIAIEEAAKSFERSFGFPHPACTNIFSSTPPTCVSLQAVDYYLWALQRFYERREDRYLELIWPHVGEIHDLDRVAEGRRGVIYTKQKPLTLAAFEK